MSPGPGARSKRQDATKPQETQRKRWPMLKCYTKTIEWICHHTMNLGGIRVLWFRVLQVYWKGFRFLIFQVWSLILALQRICIIRQGQMSALSENASFQYRISSTVHLKTKMLNFIQHRISEPTTVYIYIIYIILYIYYNIYIYIIYIP